MKVITLTIVVAAGMLACSQKPVKDEKELLSKYPKCYHISRKIFDECVRQNEAGKEVTALEIENNGLPK